MNLTERLNQAAITLDSYSQMMEPAARVVVYFANIPTIK